MKLLYITDTHLRGTTPENRKDNLPQNLKAKLQEVVEMAASYDVFALLHGGDLFDLAVPGLAVTAELLQPLKELKCPIYIVPGNHDLYGRNLFTLPRTLLGFLGRMGNLNLVGEEPIYLDDGDIRVQLSGTPYHYDVDRGDGSKYIIKKRNCDVAVHLAHGMLVDKSIFPGADYILIDSIKEETEADFTLIGHNHLGFAPYEYQGKWFINPGGLVRLSNHLKEISRRPQALLLDLEGVKPSFELIPLKTAKPGEEVLDRSKAEDAAFRAAQRADFLQAVWAGVESAKIDPYSILNEILNGSQVNQIVKDEAYRRLMEAEAEFKGELS